jgi:FeS assembly SUF system protein
MTAKKNSEIPAQAGIHKDTGPQPTLGLQSHNHLPNHLAAHAHGPMVAHADETMVRNAVGDQYDHLAVPPNTRVPLDHPLAAAVVTAIRTVYDPEIPVNIYELGLIYDVTIIGGATGADVQVRMTLTSPGCPVAQEMPGMVQAAIFPVPGVVDVDVEIVWDPTWNPSMMAETAKMQLNMFT